MHSLKVKVDVQERRKQVASLLARATSETEIAQMLHCDQSTISRDLRAIKADSNRFIYDLCREDLAYYYRESLEGIKQCKQEAWRLFNDPFISARDRLLALKVIIQADSTRFELLSSGPGLMAVKSLEERLRRIEGMER